MSESNLNQELVQAWQINSRLNLYLLNEIEGSHLDVKLDKGKTIRNQFFHIHNVRLMWVKSAAEDLLPQLNKLEEGASKEDLTKNLIQSEDSMTEIFLRAQSPAGKVKGFKPHATAFLGYLCSHESFHRTSVEITLRQHSSPDNKIALSDKIAYGLWEWGVR
jgi:uncharacterized damage-inducible protein DinB